jgi:hypothetical protein
MRGSKGVDHPRAGGVGKRAEHRCDALGTVAVDDAPEQRRDAIRVDALDRTSIGRERQNI